MIPGPMLLAHQGGWDELLWFSAPIVAVFAWVRWAERKARTRAAQRSAEAGAAASGSTLPGHDAELRNP
jgi:hypothetical protein